MNILEKITKSWWIILSFILFLNGFGFIYIGLKHNNKNWLLEGIMYELPWFFYIIFYSIYVYPTKSSLYLVEIIVIFSLLLMLVSIIRSIWVAIKLIDVYENNEKYALNPIELNRQKVNEDNNKISDSAACCLCIALIFFVFAIVLML